MTFLLTILATTVTIKGLVDLSRIFNEGLREAEVCIYSKD